MADRKDITSASYPVGIALNQTKQLFITSAATLCKISHLNMLNATIEIYLEPKLINRSAIATYKTSHLEQDCIISDITWLQ